MKQLILPALILTSWLIFLSVDIPVGGNYLPSIGRFFSPTQGIWQNAKAEHISYDFKGSTKSEVKILFDERDVPHIYADNIEDAIYAQGYLHAANRLFAMDISSRSAAGRLSELVGSRTIAIDHQQRQRGFERSAIEKAKNWERYEGNKEIIDAYVRGVNDYISTLTYADWPIEYKILSHGPVTWTPTHTALMATNMAIMLCLSESDLNYTKAKASLTAEDFNYLFPSYNPLESPIIPAGTKWDFTTMAPSNSINVGESPITPTDSIDDKNQDLHGSNNWAVAASKTANGYPILANDPHLALTLPNIWYEMEIHTPEISVHGVSLPGLPYIVIGFNESIAWGTTNSGQDVLDWYNIKWQDSSRTEYMLDGKYIKAEMRIEEIKVRGQASIVDTIRYTHWGPVTTIGDHRDMAMQWIAQKRSDVNDLAYLQKINAAHNLADYREAIEAFQYPAQNKVFASVEGDIAISVAGAMPHRPDGAGLFIADGTDSKNDWLGFIPFRHAPFIINPQRGYVSSANQSPAASDYPYPLIGVRYFEDYRGRVINGILDTMNGITVEDMKALQQNNFNLHAAELLPLLLTGLNKSACLTAEEKILSAKLSHWNYEQHRDSLSPVLFEMWYDKFEDMMLDELDTMKVMHPEDWRIIEMVKNPDHKYFDLIATADSIETGSDIICASFSEMAKDYNALDPSITTNWGTYKATEIPHLARFAPFGIKYISTSGGKHIVNAQSKTHGPSWRMIVELSKPPKAYVNYPGGQSGNPSSPHFKDFVDGFYNGKYYEVSIRKDPESWKPVRQINIHPNEK